jgi:hypothetical protein
VRYAQTRYLTHETEDDLGIGKLCDLLFHLGNLPSEILDFDQSIEVLVPGRQLPSEVLQISLPPVFSWRCRLPTIPLLLSAAPSCGSTEQDSPSERST